MPELYVAGPSAPELTWTLVTFAAAVVTPIVYTNPNAAPAGSRCSNWRFVSVESGNPAPMKLKLSPEVWLVNSITWPVPFGGSCGDMLFAATFAMLELGSDFDHRLAKPSSAFSSETLGRYPGLAMKPTHCSMIFFAAVKLPLSA